LLIFPRFGICTKKNLATLESCSAVAFYCVQDFSGHNGETAALVLLTRFCSS
jgi:hypothetical protein